MARGRPQSILILGQKKAGTTTLYNLIASSIPNKLPVPKESSVFELSPRLFRLILRLPFFRRKTVLDATTGYYRDGKFSRRFVTNLTHMENRRVILIVRDERDRVISHFRHSRALDGVEAEMSEFLASSEYLDHACLDGKLSALAEIGVTAVDILPFDALNDPVRVSEMLREILGDDAQSLPDEVREDNKFGSRSSLPRGVDRVVASPVFQTILRPLIPSGIRKAVVNLIGKPVSSKELPSPGSWEEMSGADQAKVRTINAENRQALETHGARSW